jgi:hypothetical protein
LINGMAGFYAGERKDAVGIILDLIVGDAEERRCKTLRILRTLASRAHRRRAVRALFLPL